MTALTPAQSGFIVLTGRYLPLSAVAFARCHLHADVDYRPNTTLDLLCCWKGMPELWPPIRYAYGQYTDGTHALAVDPMPTYRWRLQEAEWEPTPGQRVRAVVVMPEDLTQYVLDYWAEKYPLQALAACGNTVYTSDVTQEQP